MKKLVLKRKGTEPHWVGDGFPVRTVFSYNDVAQQLSPFLLLDHAGPAEFAPSEQRRGVGEHPHRGFETVTIVYNGEVEHRDSFGGGGLIGPGDVQWMTAAAGLVHEEMHGRKFAAQGGPFEMVQLWVNLKAQHKMSEPGYQTLTHQQIPRIELANNAGQLRVIAGEYEGVKGPARTFTPINLWDLQLNSGATVQLRVPQEHTAALFVLSGALQLEGGEQLIASELAVFDTQDEMLAFSTASASKILFLGGEPIAEPIVGYGPFVMNNEAEIRQALVDYRSGKMGRLVG